MTAHVVRVQTPRAQLRSGGYLSSLGQSRASHCICVLLPLPIYDRDVVKTPTLKRDQAKEKDYIKAQQSTATLCEQNNPDALRLVRIANCATGFFLCRLYCCFPFCTMVNGKPHHAWFLTDVQQICFRQSFSIKTDKYKTVGSLNYRLYWH